MGGINSAYIQLRQEIQNFGPFYTGDFSQAVQEIKVSESEGKK